MNEKPEPCPWCGSDLGPFLTRGLMHKQVICSTCGARGPYSNGRVSGLQNWNNHCQIVKQGMSRSRLQKALDCKACLTTYAHTDFHPPHDASPNCESGGHNHCSCDVCF